MHLYPVSAKYLKKELGKEHTIDILRDNLFGIRLREKIYRPEEKEISDDPVKKLTSELLAADGSRVFWLMVGGLMESRLKLNKKMTGSGVAGPMGFCGNSLLDFFSFLPHSVNFTEKPMDILADYLLPIPITWERAHLLLPGSIFQLTGRGKANLSGGLHLLKGAFSASLGAGMEVTPVFSIRLVRLTGHVVRVVFSRIREWKTDGSIEAGAGWSMGTNALIPHEWMNKVDNLSDRMNLQMITDALPGWKKNTKLSTYIKANSIDKLGGILQQYSSFYAKLGAEHTVDKRRLVTYDFDLSVVAAQEAFTALFYLDEKKSRRISEKSEAVSRRVFQDENSIVRTSFELGFPGKKLLLSASLRSEREGVLVCDNMTKIIRAAQSGRNYSGLFSGAKKIGWQGLEVLINDSRASYGYWKFSFKNHDKYVSEKEIIRLGRFAELFGVRAVEKVELADYPWYTKIFSHKDDIELNFDLYFTGDGLENIACSSKDRVRKVCFETAAALGYISFGAPWHDYNARCFMNRYLELLTTTKDDGEVDKYYLRKKYKKWLAEYYPTVDSLRSLADDAFVQKRVNTLVEAVAKMSLAAEGNKPDSGWAKIFQQIGNGQRFSFMVLIGSLAALAGSEGILLDLFELKESRSKKILIYVDETNKFTAAEDLFVQVSKQIEGAKL